MALAMVFFVGGISQAGGDDWRYRNHPDRFKAPQQRDYDGDGVPNYRDWRDNNYNRASNWGDDEDREDDSDGESERED